jgi:SAM-dependent methyltransferase
MTTESDARTDEIPAMYGELAPFWPLLSPPSEYEEEAAFYEKVLLAASTTALGTILELGSGGGSNASYLKRRYQMTLVDPAPGMRAVSEALNPECEHLAGDMRTVRLGRTFDAVFVHDAICYMTTEADLRRAIETAFVHCRPGGVALFAPDFVRETFRPDTECGGTDGGARGMRYLAWVWDPDPSDTTYLVDYAFLLRDPAGTVRTVHERHVEGLFARDEWLRFLREAGFEARAIPVEHADVEPGAHEVFVAHKRG